MLVSKQVDVLQSFRFIIDSADSEIINYFLYISLSLALIMISQNTKQSEVLGELLKAESYSIALQNKEVTQSAVRELIRQYFPKVGVSERLNFENLMQDDEIYHKLQKMLELHREIANRCEDVEGQWVRGREDGGGKKVTRAALQRRLQKNQQQIRKDQIFVRLTPKSQACIQFMLCNRNFPRIECKLSCNQHLQYLVNYLTNKWIRGKVGPKIVLYADSSFLKSLPLADKEKAIKDPLNNYLMFTDIMACCGVHQNGVLNLCYDVVEVKKISRHQDTRREQAVIERPVAASSSFRQLLALPQKSQSPAKRQDIGREGSLYNRNSNFYNSNQQSLFGSLGFNFNFGATPPKREQHLLSINSINYLDVHSDARKPLEDPIIQREEPTPADPKLGTLISYLEQMEKEKPAVLNQDDSQNQSNKFKDVKLVSIVKKKNPQ